MIPPQMPANEVERQAAVERYNILDTLPEPSFDSVTALIAHVSGSPVSLITMLDRDRNFLKSHHGVPFDESPREISFCGHAINAESVITVVEDATQDERFIDNPLVTEHGIRFYAGVPLVTSDNFRLGTLCIFDLKPKPLDEEIELFLVKMAKQVEILLEHRLQNQALIDYRKQLEARNHELKYFAKVVAHDIKSPVISTLYIAQSLSEHYAAELSDAVRERVDRIVNS